jgi:site-specific DNA-methyltransferase (adenine-specific)
MIKLYNDDCFNILSSIDDNSVDLILCDLPYGTTDRHGVSKTKNGSRMLKWDNILDLTKLWDEYKRIINKTHGVIVLTADQPFTSQLVLSNIEWFKYEWIWKKGKATGFLLANYRPMKLTEDILVFSPVGASPSAKKNNNCMTFNPQNLIEKKIIKKNNPKRLGKFLNQPEFMGKNNKLLGVTEYQQNYTNYPTEIIEFNLDSNHVHPTQKPIALMEYLIKTYSNENYLVLDNCMGSGTTGCACKKLNRNFIGIELDTEFYKIAKDRIENTEILTEEQIEKFFE